jgi:uncharacterized protein (TIGR03000 family)
MYSLILAMALTGGADAPADNFGCSGCTGTVVYYGNCTGSPGIFSRLFSRLHGDCTGGHYSCNGCNGGPSFLGRFHHDTYYGCCGGCHGGTITVSPVPTAAPAPAGKAPEPVPPPKELPKGEGALAPASGAAKLVVQVPTDAKVFIGSQQMNGTAHVRSFVSPILEQNRDYSYTVKVEVEHAGRTISETKEIAVRPGETSYASFTGVVASLAAAN